MVRVRKIPPPDIKAVLTRMGVSDWQYIGHDDDCIYTSAGTIEGWHSAPRFTDINAGPIAGNNASGHKLPASGRGK